MNEQQVSVIKTLLAALSSNLNASLTPEDCRILLDMLRPVSIKRQPKKRPSTAIDRLINSAAGVFYDSIENLAEDLDELRDEIRPKGRDDG